MYQEYNSYSWSNGPTVSVVPGSDADKTFVMVFGTLACLTQIALLADVIWGKPKKRKKRKQVR